MTIWKIIPGFTTYAVSDEGQVKRLALPIRNRGKKTPPERILKQSKNGKYLSVMLLRDSDEVFKTMRIQILIALAFHGPRPPLRPWALHKNDVKTDNTPNNVYWGAPRHNSADAIRNGISCAKKK